MREPETLDEAKQLIAMLVRRAETAIDQRELARSQANAVVQGFALRADGLKLVMRQAVKALQFIEAQVLLDMELGRMRTQALELSTAAIEALDKALTR